MGTSTQVAAAKSSRATGAILKLTLSDRTTGRTETLRTTANHPFLLLAEGTSPERDRVVPMQPGGLWAAAGKLKAGDRVRSASGNPLDVISVEHEARDVRVHNIEVAELHTFATGHLAALSHNACHHIIPRKVIRKIKSPQVRKYAEKFTKRLRRDVHQDLHRGGSPEWRGRGGQYSEAVDRLVSPNAAKSDIDRAVATIKKNMGW